MQLPKPVPPMHVNLRHDFCDNPKIRAVGDKAAWSFLRGLCYCAEHLTDGAIPWADAKAIAPPASIRALTMIQPGQHNPLWISGAFGVTVHDYLSYNMSAQQWANYRAKKALAGRIGGRAKALRNS